MNKPTHHLPAPPDYHPSLYDPHRYVSFARAQELLGDIKASTLREWVRNRRITSYKPGKELRFLLTDLHAFMAQHVRKSYAHLEQEIMVRQQELRN